LAAAQGTAEPARGDAGYFDSTTVRLAARPLDTIRQ
jgi:hypothetical protein